MSSNSLLNFRRRSVSSSLVSSVVVVAIARCESDSQLARQTRFRWAARSCASVRSSTKLNHHLFQHSNILNENEEQKAKAKEKPIQLNGRPTSRLERNAEQQQQQQHQQPETTLIRSSEKPHQKSLTRLIMRLVCLVIFYSSLASPLVAHSTGRCNLVS